MTLRGDAPARAFIGIGANQGDVAATFAGALRSIAALPQSELRASSATYRTPAWGITDQPDFHNAVAEIRTHLTPVGLLESLLEIERRFGRDRSRESGRWGPRVLDLDLLLYADAVLDEPGLTLPHPHMHERAFVLVPLAQIAPALIVPGRGRVSDLLAAVDTAGIEAIP